MYQHASLDRVSNFKVILRLGIGFRSLEQFFKKYFALAVMIIHFYVQNTIISDKSAYPGYQKF